MEGTDAEAAVECYESEEWECEWCRELHAHGLKRWWCALYLDRNHERDVFDGIANDLNDCDERLPHSAICVESTWNMTNYQDAGSPIDMSTNGYFNSKIPETRLSEVMEGGRLGVALQVRHTVGTMYVQISYSIIVHAASFRAWSTRPRQMRICTSPSSSEVSLPSSVFPNPSPSSLIVSNTLLVLFVLFIQTIV